VTAAGLILAAGESRRMGAPKALLTYRGTTFLETLIALFAKRLDDAGVLADIDDPAAYRSLLGAAS
jgi:molybdopterin-guanine dinucleotide biosynthesis protein A